jgi:hypothetical protein
MAVVIAQFLDDDAVGAAKTFLALKGIAAISLDKSGYKSTGPIQLLVPTRHAARAANLLKRAEQGEFADAWPGKTATVSQAAIELSQALTGENLHRYPVWLYVLPVWAAGLGLLALLIGAVAATLGMFSG